MEKFYGVDFPPLFIFLRQHQQSSLFVMHVLIFLVHEGESVVVRNVGELDQAGETISFQFRMVLLLLSLDARTE